MVIPLNNQAVIVKSMRLLILLIAENYSYGAYSRAQFTGRLLLSAAQLEQQLRGQTQLLIQKQRDRKSLQGPLFHQAYV